MRMTEIERAVELLGGILPTADSWMDAPADSFAVVEHIANGYFYADDGIEETIIRGQYTVWTRADQGTLQQYMDDCAAALAGAGWVLGPVQAENAVVNGTAWYGQTREISFLE